MQPSQRSRRAEGCIRCKLAFVNNNFASKIILRRKSRMKVASGCSLRVRRLHPDATFALEGCIRMQPSVTRYERRRLHPDATFAAELYFPRFFLTFKVEGCIRMQPSFVTGEKIMFFIVLVLLLLCKSHFKLIEMNYVELHLNQK